MPGNFYEKDLYPPVKRYFEELGYTVRSEVRGVDMTAIIGSRMALFEFKRSFTAGLLFQALDRQRISGATYMVIPRPKRTRVLKQITHIAEKLELGLVTVDLQSKAAFVDCEPCFEKTLNNKRSRAVFKEAASRALDGNAGGSVNAKLLTAYRERSVQVACALYKNGQMRAAELKSRCRAPDCAAILRNNYYGWFIKTGNGFYFLSDLCFNEIEHGRFKAAFDFFMRDTAD